MKYNKFFEAEDNDSKAVDKAESAIKVLVNDDWGKDNDSQGKASELFKALSFNDSDIANEFMDEINKFTSGLKNKYLK